MNKITVVIPTKNRQEWLFRAIKSINGQTRIPYEVIVVDDGSEKQMSIHDIADVLDDRIKCNYIFNSTSLGGGESRNIGIRASLGDYILFLDDDDALAKNYIELNIELLQQDSFFFTNKLIVKDTQLDNVIRETHTASKNIHLSNFIGGTSGVFVSKSALIEVGLFDPNLKAFQDYELWLRLCDVLTPKMNCPKGVIYTVFDNQKLLQISSNYNNHISALKYIIEKHAKSPYLREINSTLLFFVAKSIHRKNYFKSIPYLFRSLSIRLRFRAIILLVPYRVLNIFNIHTT